MSGRVHMVGIGGIGMSALAQLLLAVARRCPDRIRSTPRCSTD